MSTTLASDMVRKSLGAFLESVERPQEFSPDEARELLAIGEMPLVFLERLWQLTQGFLDRGMESKKLAFFLKELMDVLALGMKAFDTASTKVKKAGLEAEELTQGVAMLEYARRRAARMRDELSVLLRRLETPPREVDLSSLPGGREAPDAKGYVRMDDLAARLLARDKD